MRCGIGAMLGVLIVPMIVNAQVPVRFPWQAGKTTQYEVEHTTTVTTTAPIKDGAKPVAMVTHTRLNLTRQWAVKAVDAEGVASLEQSILKFKQVVQKPTFESGETPGSDTLTIDSTTPDGAKQMGAFLKKPIVFVKVDPRGAVKDVKAITGEAAAARLHAELPFRIVLPETAPGRGMSWSRNFQVKLEPPLGAGESYELKQTYTFRGLSGPQAVFGVETQLTNPPKDHAELQPLLPWLWMGDVFLDAQTGEYQGAKLTIRKELLDPSATGAKFLFESQFTETLVPH